MGWIIASVFLNIIASCSHAMAAAGDTQTPSSSFGVFGVLIMWYICGSQRKKEIGGWLLYYYIQVYIGVIISLLIFAFSFKNYLPSFWAGNPKLYLPFLASTIPSVLLKPVQLCVAEKLRLSRDFAFVRLLRYVLWAELASSVIATVIDFEYFPKRLGADAIGYVWPAIWLPYFYTSKRVKLVFETKDWLTPAVTGATT